MKIEILEAAGLSAEQIIRVLKAEQVAETLEAAERIANEREMHRQRQRRYLERKRNGINEGVTEMTRHTVTSVPPSSPLSLSPPITPSITIPPSSPSRTRGRRLAPGWVADEADERFAASLGLSPAQIAEQAERFRDYWVARPGAGGIKLDWAATWRTWIRRAKDGFGGSRPLQDDSKSISAACGRLAELARKGEFVLGPRPSLIPRPREGADVIPLLSAGRSK